MQRGFEVFGGRVTCSSGQCAAMCSTYYDPFNIVLTTCSFVLTEHTLSMVPTVDGLKHRPRSEWAVMYMNCESNDAETWLKSALSGDESKEVGSSLSLVYLDYSHFHLYGLNCFQYSCFDMVPIVFNVLGFACEWLTLITHLQHIIYRQPVEKCYFLSVSKVSYGREAVIPHNERPVDTPTHRLVVHGLKGAWTKSNRDVAFALFDTVVKTKVR